METISQQLYKYHKEINHQNDIITNELAEIKKSITLLLIYYKKTKENNNER